MMMSRFSNSGEFFSVTPSDTESVANGYKEGTPVTLAIQTRVSK